MGEDERLVRCSDKGTDSASRPDKVSVFDGRLIEHSPHTVIFYQWNRRSLWCLTSCIERHIEQDRGVLMLGLA